MVGIAVAVFSDAGSASVQRMTFGVPARSLARTLASLAATGTAPPPLGGITLAPRDVAKSLAGSPDAVLIQSITPASPAADAGMRGTTRGLKGVQAGDVIVEPPTTAAVAAALEGAAAGEGVHLTVVRDGGERVEVTVVM